MCELYLTFHTSLSGWYLFVEFVSTPIHSCSHQPPGDFLTTTTSALSHSEINKCRKQCNKTYEMQYFFSFIAESTLLYYSTPCIQILLLSTIPELIPPIALYTKSAQFTRIWIPSQLFQSTCDTTQNLATGLLNHILNYGQILCT